jgi:hypothetical protein
LVCGKSGADQPSAPWNLVSNGLVVYKSNRATGLPMADNDDKQKTGRYETVRPAPAPRPAPFSSVSSVRFRHAFEGFRGGGSGSATAESARVLDLEALHSRITFVLAELRDIDEHVAIPTPIEVRIKFAIKLTQEAKSQVEHAQVAESRIETALEAVRQATAALESEPSAADQAFLDFAGNVPQQQALEAEIAAYAGSLRQAPEIAAGRRQDKKIVDSTTPSFRLWLTQIWGYAFALAVGFIGIGKLLSGSFVLLVPIVCVCIAGGIVGTLLAFLRSIEEKESAVPRDAFQNRIFR